MEPWPIIVGGVHRKTVEIAEVRFPYNGELYSRVCQAGREDIDTAIASAVKGFEQTRQLSSGVRSRILIRLAGEIHKRAAELTEILVMEGGKTQKFAATEVSRAEETIRISAEEAKRQNGEVLPLDWQDEMPGRIGLLQRFPIGPVVAIIPFNFPVNLACHKFGPAIAAGNSIILKPASATPVSALILGEMAIAAGMPPEAVSVLPCPGARAEQLATDPRVAFLSFTGSCTVGWHLKEVAGRKKVGLELGGNAAVIVHSDANLDYAVSRIVAGAFNNAGQICISVQRVLIHRPVYEQTVEKLLVATKALVFGDPRNPSTDLGPMIDEGKAREAHGKIREAAAQGARILTGGELKGSLFSPTVLADTTPEMRVNSEELFAPAITVIPYDDFEEAIRTVNASPFGLQAGIFTRDIGRAMESFSRMEVGGVMVNDIPTFRVDQMPYGGVKNSGTGREGPRFAIEEMTEPRLLVINPAGGK